MAKKKVKGKTSGPVQRKQQKEPFFQGNTTILKLVGAGILLLLGIIIYSNSFSGAFHFDDLNNIVNNAKLRDISDVDGIWAMSGGRFLSYFSFAVNYHYGELNVWGYHFVNLIIHLINAGIVWWLTTMLFKTPVLQSHRLAKYAVEIGFFTALLFVSHPLATMSVTYIVQRMASMVAMFYLLTVGCYIKARLEEGQSAKRYALFFAAIVFAIMAMMTKENAYTIPFAIVLIEVFFLQTRKFAINFKDYRILLALGATAFMAFIILTKLSLSIFNPIPPGIDHPYTITPMNYLMTQFSVITKYLQLLVLPVNQNVDYDYALVENFFEVKTILSFLFLVGLVTVAILSFKKHRILSFGILWFFLTIAIESSVVPILDLIFEHRTYLPSFGFFLILTTYVYYFFRDKNKQVAIGILVLIIGVNSFLTYQRNKVWKDEVTLLEDVVKKSPAKPRPYVNLGSVFMDKGEWEKAAGFFSQAIDIKPDYLDAYNNRGAAYTNLKKLDLAIQDYSKAIEINPAYVEAYYNRGITYGNLGQWDKAIADYSAALQYNPGNAQLYFNRGNAYLQLKDYNLSVADFTRAIQLDPSIASVYLNRGFAYERLNQMAEAINDYDAVLNLQPNLLAAIEKKAMAQANLGQWANAIEGFSKMIELNPRNENYYYNRGYSYENLGQWQPALEDYDRVLQINPKMEKALAGRNYVMNKLRASGN